MNKSKNNQTGPLPSAADSVESVYDAARTAARALTVFRQGDVLIERIATIPAAAIKQKRANNIVLAHGEVTGHHHVLETADPADWWKSGEIPTTNEKPKALIGEIFLKLESPAEITHQEHATIPLPPGSYRVTRQREYSPEAIRNVAD